MTSLTMSMIKETLIWLIRNPQLPNQIALAIGHSKKILRSNRISSCKFFVYFAQKNYFLYFTHQFLRNTHISLSILHIYSIKYLIFYNFLLFPHSLPLSLTNPTLPKNTKILNARATVTMHICTVPVACAFMHNFTSTDVSVFLLKMCKMDYFCILHDFAWADRGCSNKRLCNIIVQWAQSIHKTQPFSKTILSRYHISTNPPRKLCHHFM